MAARDTNRFLRIGEVARQAGVSPDTLRHYERKGVLPRPGRSASGYRAYPPSTVSRLLIVRRAMAVGFTLDELARILKERDRGGAPCRAVRELARQKLESMERQLVELSALRATMKALLRDWDLRLAKPQPGGRAGLLDSLTTSAVPSRSGRRPLPRKGEDE